MFDLTAVPMNRTDYFLCPYLGKWIPWLFVCNGVNDCSNGAEERWCDLCEYLNFTFISL